MKVTKNNSVRVIKRQAKGTWSVAKETDFAKQNNIDINQFRGKSVIHIHSILKQQLPPPTYDIYPWPPIEEAERIYMALNAKAMRRGKLSNILSKSIGTSKMSASELIQSHNKTLSKYIQSYKKAPSKFKYKKMTIK